MKINRHISGKALGLILALGLPSIAFGQLPLNKSCPTSFVPSTGGCLNLNYNAMLQSVQTNGGITNFANMNTGCTNLNGTAYNDYTGDASKVVTQEAGKTFDLVVTYRGSTVNANTTNTLLGVFIDWNRDGVFSKATNPPHPIATALNPDFEEWLHLNVLTGTPGPHPFQATNNTAKTIKITIPGHAKEGKTRMRVMCASAPGAAQVPEDMFDCAANADGEVEDYTLEVINPCLPPNIISVEAIGNFNATLAWSKKPNAEFYEYLIQDHPTPPPSLGYSYTTDAKISTDTLQCDKTYYLFVRTICDTVGRTAAIWKRSDWKVDSFHTHPCCDNPIVTVDKPDAVNRTMRISWPPVYTATGYEYAYGRSDVPPSGNGTYTTSNVVVLQGLNPSVRYYVFVRARCNPTPLSGWTKLNFKAMPTTSVDDVESNSVFGMDAYPNPVADKLTIKLDGKMAANAKVTILDLTGKVVYNQAVKTQEMNINTAGFPAGLYIVKYTDDVHNEITRVTKR